MPSAHCFVGRCTAEQRAKLTQCLEENSYPNAERTAEIGALIGMSGRRWSNSECRVHISCRSPPTPSLHLAA